MRKLVVIRIFLKTKVINKCIEVKIYTIKILNTENTYYFLFLYSITSNYILFYFFIINFKNVFIEFSEINSENQKALENGTQISLAKGPNKDLLR